MNGRFNSILDCGEQILAIHAQVEELVTDEESLAYLGKIGQVASLRLIFSLLSDHLIVYLYGIDNWSKKREY